MKIDILCNDGSPLGVTMKDLWGKGSRGIGIGGSEYGLLTVAEGLVNAGHDVRLYNDPKEADASPFEQLPIRAFDPTESRDVIVTFRSPNPRSIVSKGLKVWWSCDQYTIGSFKDFACHMDRIVCISPFHENHFKVAYGITGVDVIDIPVRIEDFDLVSEEPVIPKRCIFTSVPDRGLQLLRPVWSRLKMREPDASLVITSDYRLWGLPDPRNEQHRMGWMNMPDVYFVGAVPRMELLLQQAMAQLLLYPCVYDELFCVAVAEAESMGVIPITSTTGALATTNMGDLISGDPKNLSGFGNQMVDLAIGYMNNPSLYGQKSKELMVKSRERFSVGNIIRKWEKVLENEDMLD